MGVFIQNYEIILIHLQLFYVSIDVFQQIRKPKFTNLEVIAMNIADEYIEFALNYDYFYPVGWNLINWFLMLFIGLSKMNLLIYWIRVNAVFFPKILVLIPSKDLA